MELVKKTDDYTIYKKRSGRYDVKNKDKKYLSEKEKIEILLKENDTFSLCILIKSSFTSTLSDFDEFESEFIFQDSWTANCSFKIKWPDGIKFLPFLKNP